MPPTRSRSSIIGTVSYRRPSAAVVHARRLTAGRFRRAPLLPGRAFRTGPLVATRRHYDEVLGRAVVVTPDANVNRGVLWAKANMLRTELYAPSGWCFVNDPTRSNNSVGRDTASFAFGSDYVTPDFSRESLRWYFRNAQRSGKIVEYYDVRNGEANDYGLNVNDDTPLIILALNHHHLVTGDLEFLRESYAAAKRAAEYLLDQRDARGLIWCTSTKTSMWGIVGWRNIIDDYRISGASTEVNSECYAAFAAMAMMAEALGREKDKHRFQREAFALRAAINRHLIDPNTDSTTSTSTLTAGRVRRLPSTCSFPWCSASPNTTRQRASSAGSASSRFGPRPVFGLLAATISNIVPSKVGACSAGSGSAVPSFMPWRRRASIQALWPTRSARASSTIRATPDEITRSRAQFSEWLHGETLANQGMMLSPWYPPRYVWSAIEGACGLEIRGTELVCNPRLAPQWKWLGARNVSVRGKRLTWFVARIPEPKLYASFTCASELTLETYERDVTPMLRLSDDVTEIALQRRGNFILFIGNTATRTVTTPLRFARPPRGRYRVRYFTSLIGEWIERESLDARKLEVGFAIDLDALGFCVIELVRESVRPRGAPRRQR